jgi:putative hydrolase
LRGDRHYTALYSNTALAHQLGTEHDWVIIYRDDHDGDGQWTVVTARSGPLRGYRVIRGREAECSEFYDRNPGQPLPFLKPASTAPESTAK